MVSVASAILGCGAWSHDSEKFGASEARSQMASSQSACAMPVSFDLMPLTGGTSPSFKYPSTSNASSSPSARKASARDWAVECALIE